MNKKPIIHPRIYEKHPEITEEDVVLAWQSCIRSVPRLDKESEEYIAIGTDNKGRLIEMIARRISLDEYIIFHAFTPPTNKALRELRMIPRRHK